MESRDRDLGHGRFGAAADHDIGLAQADQIRGIDEGVSRRSASGGYRVVGPLVAVAHGDHAGCHVGDGHGHEEGTDTARAAGHEGGAILFDGADAADAATDHDADARLVQPLDTLETGVFDGLGGRADRVLEESVEALGFLGLDVGFDVEVLHLAGDTGTKICRIEVGDGSDARTAFDESFPEGLERGAHGADDPHASDDDALRHAVHSLGCARRRCVAPTRKNAKISRCSVKTKRVQKDPPGNSGAGLCQTC